MVDFYSKCSSLVLSVTYSEFRDKKGNVLLNSLGKLVYVCLKTGQCDFYVWSSHVFFGFTFLFAFIAYFACCVMLQVAWTLPKPEALPGTCAYFLCIVCTHLCFASSQNEAVCFLFFVFKKFFKQNVALPVTEGVQSSCSTCFCSWCPSMEGPATVANILP